MVLQTSFHWETSGGDAKFQFSFSLAMLLAIYENEWRKFQEKNLAPLSKKIIAIGTMAPST